jgi:integrase
MVIGNSHAEEDNAPDTEHQSKRSLKPKEHEVGQNALPLATNDISSNAYSSFGPLEEHTGLKDGHHGPEQSNNHSGMGEAQRRGGRRRKGRNPMGRYPWRASVAQYIKSFQGLTEDYAEQTEDYLLKCERYLITLGLPTKPRELTAEHIKALYNKGPWVSLHERWMILTRLRPFLRFCKNAVMDDRELKRGLDLSFPTPQTKSRYTEAEIQALLSTPEHPYAKWLIHLEAEYGARRVTVKRSRTEDFDRNHILNGSVILRVKGRGGNKTMEANLHPDTERILNEVLRERQDVIERCRRKGWTGEEPHELLLHKYKKEPHPVTDSGLDNILTRLCEDAGVEPRGHHAIRRGVARIAYNETNDLVATQSFLGHADPKTTEDYIGLDLSKQEKAQKAIRNRLKTSIPSN